MAATSNKSSHRYLCRILFKSDGREWEANIIHVALLAVNTISHDLPFADVDL